MRSEPSANFISTPSRTSSRYRCRETRKPVADFERDAGLGRGISVADAGLRESVAQTVQHRLIGDLAGQTNVARRDFADRGRHQRAAPMRRRAGQMRDAVPGQDDRDGRRSARRRSTAPAKRRRARRARKSASRHNGGCRRRCPKPPARRRCRGLIGAVNAARVCATIFGTPVVPDVSNTHSVCSAWRRQAVRRLRSSA